MDFVYKPEGVTTPKKWEFDPDRLMSPEAEAIERLTGFTFAEWTVKVQSGSMLAIHGFLYVMLKRDNPTLKWDEVQFNLTMIDFELTDEETAEQIADLESRVDELSPGELAYLDDLRAQAPATVEVDEDPKDD